MRKRSEMKMVWGVPQSLAVSREAIADVGILIIEDGFLGRRALWTAPGVLVRRLAPYEDI